MLYKSLLSVACLLLLSYAVTAQQQPLTIEDVRTWPIIRAGGLSPNGEYAHYKIMVLPHGVDTVVFKGIKDGWEKKYSSSTGRLMAITMDGASKHAYFRLPSDTLVMLELGKEEVKRIPGVSAFQLIEFGKQRFLVLQKQRGDLEVHDLTAGRTKRFANTKRYVVGNKRESLAILTNDDQDNRITYVDLRRWEESVVPTEQEVADFTFDANDRRIVCIS